MAKTMSRSTLDEYLEKMRCRYRRYTGKPAKGRLLDEFCQVSGDERKYASKWLSRRRGPGSRGRGPEALGRLARGRAHRKGTGARPGDQSPDFPKSARSTGTESLGQVTRGRKEEWRW